MLTILLPFLGRRPQDEHSLVLLALNLQEDPVVCPRAVKAGQGKNQGSATRREPCDVPVAATVPKSSRAQGEGAGDVTFSVWYFGGEGTHMLAMKPTRSHNTTAGLSKSILPIANMQPMMSNMFLFIVAKTLLWPLHEAPSSPPPLPLLDNLAPLRRVDQRPPQFQAAIRQPRPHRAHGAAPCGGLDTVLLILLAVLIALEAGAGAKLFQVLRPRFLKVTEDLK